MSPLTNFRCVLTQLLGLSAGVNLRLSAVAEVPTQEVYREEPHLYSVLSLALYKCLVSCKSHYFRGVEYLNFFEPIERIEPSLNL